MLIDEVDLVGDIITRVHSIRLSATLLSGLTEDMAVLKKRAILAVSS